MGGRCSLRGSGARRVSESAAPPRLLHPRILALGTPDQCVLDHPLRSRCSTRPNVRRVPLPTRRNSMPRGSASRQPRVGRSVEPSAFPSVVVVVANAIGEGLSADWRSTGRRGLQRDADVEEGRPALGHRQPSVGTPGGALRNHQAYTPCCAGTEHGRVTPCTSIPRTEPPPPSGRRQRMPLP